MIHVARDAETGVDLAYIEGPLSQSRGTTLRAALLDLVGTGSGKLVLNLAGVTFVDSHGLATLVSVWKAMSYREGRIVLSAIPGDIEALFELTRLQSLFEIFPSDHAAVLSMMPSDKELVGEYQIGLPVAPSGGCDGSLSQCMTLA